MPTNSTRRMQPGSRPRPALRFRPGGTFLEDRTVPSTLPNPISVLIPNQVHVVIDPATDTPANEAVLEAAPFASDVQHLGFGIYSVTLKPGTTASQAINYYSAQSAVSFAEQNSKVSVQATPNDPNFPANLYGMTKIDAPSAW